MGFKEVLTDEKCPKCGTRMFRWSLKNPFVDEGDTYCKRVVNPEEDEEPDEYCHGRDPSHGYRSARSNARAEEQHDRAMARRSSRGDE